MSRAELHFDLDDIEDSNRFRKSVKVIDYSLALWQLSRVLRPYIKYEEGSKLSKEELLYKIQNDILNIYEEYNINIDELD